MPPPPAPVRTAPVGVGLGGEEGETHMGIFPYWIRDIADMYTERAREIQLRLRLSLSLRLRLPTYGTAYVGVLISSMKLCSITLQWRPLMTQIF